MLKRFCTALTFLGSSVIAQTPAPDVWQMAFDGDLAGLEQAFATAHAEIVSGEAQPQSVRKLMTELMVTHPVVLQTAQNWLAEYPQSPYALTAVGFQMQHIGWVVRGDGMAHEVHPEAMAVMQDFHHEGYAHMQEAYAIAPDFLPAADGMITLNRTLGILSKDDVQAIAEKTLSS
ncbi:DUF4034 domain-containing protein [Yoonia sp. 208BN28-4]|uniref:DUF4034 domain-containing protein n=1 Tax=Yoonia sp. 208BN28-4 TaxID=3126505 RepID=UPI0030A3D003